MDTPMQARSADDIRRRHTETVAGGSNFVQNADQNGHTNTRPHPPGSMRRNHRTSQSTIQASIAYMITCGFYILIALFVHSRLNSYPKAKLQASSERFEFLEENARAHLELITGVGPRVAGSDANIESERYIIHTINRIRKEALLPHKIDLDIQRVSGSFTLDFINVGIGEFTSVYQNLTNIVVKLSPSQDAKDSVMVNCHYDTVIDSPANIYCKRQSPKRAAYSSRVSKSTTSDMLMAIIVNTVILAESEKQLQAMLDHIVDKCKDYGMKIKVKKTKTMHIGRDTKALTITVGNAVLEQISKYSYLGHIITEDVATPKEVQIGTEKTRQKFLENKGLLQRNIGLNTKKRILGYYIFSVFNYGCKAWTYSKAVQKKKCGATGYFSRSQGQKRKT
ncbi:endoplasmic reticulum metallopeptidase 1-like [Elysia marginata]|uniref:Endoplasmic reticulum metallopeptidase 1-like n=1 Tax=Elysia marginata TaxID=1093978 RepID=A0AAV4GD88_9GAST|nr:endoplasmic reticulum metallopeptidase 1-like [Elysia marginata]